MFERAPTSVGLRAQDRERAFSDLPVDCTVLRRAPKASERRSALEPQPDGDGRVRRKRMHTATRWLQEPVVLFVLGAAVLFAIDAVLRPPPPTQIRITSAQVRALATLHEARTGAPPSDEVLRRAVEQLAEDEAIYRYGVDLGIVEGDPIVRRRIVSKIRQAARTVAEPSDEALAAWHAEHAEEFAVPLTLSVEHRFYGPGSAGRSRAAAALIDSSPPPGRPAPLGPRLAEATPERIGRWLGQRSAEMAQNAPLDEWFGPFESPHGWHIGRVVRRDARRVPSLAEVRGAARDALLRDLEAQAESETIARIVRRHDLSIDWPAPAQQRTEAPQ